MTVPGSSGRNVAFELEIAGQTVVEFPSPRRARTLGWSGRLGVAIAAGAPVVMFVYALLQVTAAAGVLAAPPDTVPLFWRLKIGVLACLVSGPGLWRLGRARYRSQARILSLLILASAGAITLCAVVLP